MQCSPQDLLCLSLLAPLLVREQPLRGFHTQHHTASQPRLRPTHAQKSVGTVVKTAEDVDPIGLLTVLALARHRELTCLRQLLAFLRQRCPDKAAEQRLLQARFSCEKLSDSAPSACAVAISLSLPAHRPS